MHPFSTCFAALLCTGATLCAQSWSGFEARHTHSIALTPDGTRLLAVNSTEGRLSVFDVRDPSNPAPVLTDEIPAGLEPVAVRARTDDEVWVVNEVSDSVSVISLSRRCIVATLPVPDEPADVVFAGGKAYVSCARSNELRVFDPLSRTQLAVIPLTGLYPRALAASPDGARVFAAFFLSGNGTTTLTAAEAPAPPAPTNAALPAAPKTALIVPASDPRVPYTVLDNDVAEIDTASGAVLRYHTTLGTNIHALAIAPDGGKLWAAATDARNLTRFEPALNGHFSDHLLSTVTLPGGAKIRYDLNPGVEYALKPNPAAQATALAQPTALVLSPDGSAVWTAAYASDRIAKVNTADGSVLARVDVRTSGGSRKMRGPRALALHSGNQRLFVLNKLSDSISVISTATATVLAEVPLSSHDPMPAALREGRGFLFDARLSGNGLSSCGVCHPDADRDGVAWDLGDPGGQMLTVTGYNNSIHDTTPRNRVLHPMKGPMTTQTLRGFTPGQIFHWRGDRATMAHFNATYRDLMAGDLIPSADMDALTAWLNTLKLHPNPHRRLNRTLPATLAGGNPTNGHALFTNHLASHCITCHALPTGSDNNIDLMNEVGSTQPVKTPHLRTVYQRAQFSRAPGAVNVSGYGMLKDGTGHELPIGHFYVLENLANLQEYTDVKAYVLSFDTGVAPAVGYSITFTPDTAADAAKLADLTTLEGQTLAACDLTVRGRAGGQLRSWLFSNARQKYTPDIPGAPELTRAELLALLTSGDALTFMGVLPGDGPRYSISRTAPALLNAAAPAPALEISAPVGSLRLAWPATADDWVLESSPALLPPWAPVTLPRGAAGGVFRIEPPVQPPGRFYRLRRTW